MKEPVCVCGHSADLHSAIVSDCLAAGCFCFVYRSATPEPTEPVEASAAPDVALPDGLVLANDAEHELIERLALVVGHRLLLEWDAVEPELRVLSMNRAALSALARALGTFLAAVASVQPENHAGWDVVVEHALAIARQTAHEKRLEVLNSPDAGALVQDDPAKPVYVFPAPDAVM